MKSSEAEHNVYLITGTDQDRISHEAGKLARKAAGEDADAFALDVIREQDGVDAPETINQVVRSIMSPPFMGGRKTVWLQNFGAFDKEGSSKSKTPESIAIRSLADAIADGVPDDIVLILSGNGVDGRRKLAKSCKKSGAVIVYDKPDVSDRNWEGRMLEVIRTRASEKGIRLDRRVASYLVDAIGTDTARVEAELEKLICYTGGTDQRIRLEDAEQICSGRGEAISWALNDAVGHRQLGEALRLVNVLTSTGKNPDAVARRLLAQTANLYRQLLQVRTFMMLHKLRRSDPVMRMIQNMDDEKKQEFLSKGFEFVGGHPYRAKMLAEQALKYSGPELIQAIRSMRDANLKTVTSSMSARIALEEAVLRIMGMPRRSPGRSRH